MVPDPDEYIAEKTFVDVVRIAAIVPSSMHLCNAAISMPSRELPRASRVVSVAAHLSAKQCRSEGTRSFRGRMSPTPAVKLSETIYQ
jgi:hypothetical protein